MLAVAHTSSVYMSGRTVGLLPNNDANPYVGIAVPTVLGHASNVIVQHNEQRLCSICLASSWQLSTQY